MILGTAARRHPGRVGEESRRRAAIDGRWNSQPGWRRPVPRFRPARHDGIFAAPHEAEAPYGRDGDSSPVDTIARITSAGPDVPESVAETFLEQGEFDDDCVRPAEAALPD